MSTKQIFEKQFVKSKFLHLFEKNDKYILLHSLLLRPLFIDKESLLLLNKFDLPTLPLKLIKEFPQSQSFIEHLIKEKLIVQKDTQEVKIFREWVNKIYNDDGKSILYIIPTDQCNIRCKYCFVENSMETNHNYTFMNVEIMQKGVDFFAQNALKSNIINPVVIFYGGEPLLNYDLVHESINYISQNYPHFKISILTNGMLITEKIADFFKEKNVSVGISIDGAKEIHNNARIYKNGKGTYGLVEKGIACLKSSGFENISFSLTVGKHNVNTLVDEVKYLYNKFHPNSFGINFLVDPEFDINPYSVSIEDATLQVIEAFKFLREKGIYEDRMMRKVKPFINGEIHLKDCGAPGNQIVLAPNGDIGPCQGFLPSRKYFTQNINRSPNLIDDISFNEWSKRYPVNMKECIDCEALGICGGGCPYHSSLRNGSIWELDERMCKHNKLLIDWLVWETCEVNN